MFARHDKALGALVTRKERMYYALMLVTSLAVYAGLAIVAGTEVDGAAAIAGYILMFVLVAFVMNGYLIGNLRGNGVRVSPRQFPRLHRLFARHAATIGLADLPDIYVVQSGGLMNAFATRFLSRDFVVVYSDVLAMAEESGEPAVGFIVAHELAHVARGHLRYRWLTLPGRLIPYLGTAYSRACEYTCDAFGAHCQPDGAVDGLLALAAGPALYRHVDAAVFAEQARTEDGFWSRRAEWMSTHPHLTKRVGAVLAALPRVPAYTPVADAAASRHVPV